MDDYEPWLTPCDPDFDPEKCESAYALWAVKEEGEPVKFLEASITDNLDYPSGYWFLANDTALSAHRRCAAHRYVPGQSVSGRIRRGRDGCSG